MHTPSMSEASYSSIPLAHHLLAAVAKVKLHFGIWLGYAVQVRLLAKCRMGFWEQLN